MDSMRYEEVEQFLEKNTKAYIDFEEYGYISGRKTLLLKIEGLQINTYIKENEFIDRETIERLYGEEANPNHYYYYPYIRLVIEQEIDNREVQYSVLHLNKVYFTSGLQKIQLRSSGFRLGEQGVKPWINHTVNS